jgi:hypothetical protein
MFMLTKSGFQSQLSNEDELVVLQLREMAKELPPEQLELWSFYRTNYITSSLLLAFFKNASDDLVQTLANIILHLEWRRDNGIDSLVNEDRTSIERTHQIYWGGMDRVCQQNVSTTFWLFFPI